MRLFLLLIILIAFIQQSLTLILDYWTINRAYCINLLLGTPPQKQNKIIDQFHFKSFSSYLYYSIQKSNTSQVIGSFENFRYFKTIHYNASIISDVLTLKIPKSKNITIQQFPILYINESIKETSSLQNPISFAYNFEDNSFSFIHHLHSQGIISYLSYSFVPDNIYFGNLFLGEEPQNKIIGMNKAYCDIDRNKKYWSCPLTYVNLINGTNLSLEKKDESEVKYWSFANTIEIAYFQSGEGKIIAPYSFRKWLNTTFFEKYFEMEQCYTISLFKRIFYSCKCDVLNFFPDIFEIVIGNFSFRFPKEALYFQYKDDTSDCEFEFTFEKDNEDKWVLGTPFLNQFISTFDYEQHKVFFYSKESFENKRLNRKLNTIYIKNFIIKMLFGIIIIGSLLLSPLLIRQIIIFKKHPSILLD